MAKKKEITKGVTVTLTIAQIEFIDRNFRNRSEAVRKMADFWEEQHAKPVPTPAEAEAEKRANKALTDEASRWGLRGSIEHSATLGSILMERLRYKRLGRPDTYTFTEFLVLCRENRPGADPALMREIAKELWDECDPDGQPGPAVPP